MKSGTMGRYDVGEIRRRGDCEQYARDHGAEVTSYHRAKAWWRNGDGENISFGRDDDGASVFYDHARKVGGCIIELVMCAEFGGKDNANFLPAVATIAERMGMKPLILSHDADEYITTARYCYRNVDGSIAYEIVRLELFDDNGKRIDKKFKHVQNGHNGLEAGTKHILYNLPSIAEAKEVFYVEGEKDADTLTRWGYVATTNSGGAGNFPKDTAEVLRDKHVIILPDNDAAGQNHAHKLAEILFPTAASVRIITLSDEPKGDVTDWSKSGVGNNGKRLRTIVDSTPPINHVEKAHFDDICNYTEYSSREEDKNGFLTDKIAYKPLPIQAITNDIFDRFNQFPRIIGDMLFDYNEKENKVIEIRNSNSMMAWLQRRGDCFLRFRTGIGYVMPQVLFENFFACSRRYEGICNAPFFPERENVFNIYKELPKPSEGYRHFWKLIDMFSPSDAVNRLLLAAFFVAPMIYLPHSSRPMWIIDTIDAQASGKSKLCQALFRVYDNKPILEALSTIQRDPASICKRILSSSGRRSRFVWFDNVTHTIQSDVLAQFVTSAYFSGRRAYGHGEETRENDITFIATMNGAEVDQDMATRCYTVNLRKSTSDTSTWETKTFGYIEAHRDQIIGEIYGMLKESSTADKPYLLKDSRFQAFDRLVFGAVCQSESEYDKVRENVAKEICKANKNYELADEFADMVEEWVKLAFPREQAPTHPIFFYSYAVTRILASVQGALRGWNFRVVYRELVKPGLCYNIAPNISKVPDAYGKQNGVLWFPDGYKIEPNRLIEAAVVSVVQVGMQITFLINRNVDGFSMIQFHDVYPPRRKLTEAERRIKRNRRFKTPDEPQQPKEAKETK